MAVREDVAKTIVLIDGKQGLNELGKLELQKNDNIRALKGMKKGTDEYVKASKQLKQTEKLIDAQREKLGLAGMTYQQLIRYQRDLRRQMNNTTTKGTKEYERLRKKFLEVNDAVTEQRKALKGTSNTWRDIKKLVLGGGILGLMLKAIFLVNQALRKMWDEVKAISEAWADVRKNTELTRFQILGLTNDLRKIDTKTALKGLIALAAQAGKLGLKSRKDLAAFVKEADKIGVALGDDLGDDVEKSLRTIGKMVEIYKIGERNGLDFGESMNKLGSAINEVTTKGTNQAEFLVDYMERLGGMGRTTTLTAQQNLGYAATYDELGQSAEVAGTVTTQVINLMHKDVVTFAGIAKMQIGEFNDLLKKDTNAALIAVLEGLHGNNEGLAMMTKKLDGVGLRGTRAIGVLAALSSSTDKLRERQAQANKAFQEGTSINNEFQAKMESIPASLARISNAISNAFVGSKFVSGLERTFKSIADFFQTIDNQESKAKDQFVEFKKMQLAIFDVNTATEERIKLIKELQGDYPDLLGNIEAEKISNEDLALALKDVNSEMLNRIIIARQEDKIVKVQERRAELLEKITTLEFDLTAHLAKVAAERNFEIDPNKNLAEQAEALKNLLDPIKLESGYNRTQYDQIDLFLRSINSRNKQLKKSEEELTEVLSQKDFILKKLNITQKKAIDLSAGNAKPDPPSVIVTAAEIEAQVKESLSALENGEQRLIDQLRQQYLERELTEDEFNQALARLQHSTLLAKEVAMSQHLTRIKDLEFSDAGEKQELTRELADQERDLQAEIHESEYQLALAEMQRQIALVQKSRDETERLEKEITTMLRKELAERYKAKMKYRKDMAKSDEKEIQAWHKNRKAKEKNDKAIADAERLKAEAVIESAHQSGAAAVENAETMEEAAVAVINSIREQVKAVINLAVAEVMKSVLKSVPFPANIIAATTAGALVNGLFNKLIPPLKTKKQKKEGLFFGGDTGSGTIADGDAYGAFSNVPVHQHELVIPSFERQDPVVLNTEAYLKARNPRFRSNIDAADVPPIGMTPEQGDMLISSIQQLIAVVNAPKHPQKSYVVLREIQGAQNQEDRARGSSL